MALRPKKFIWRNNPKFKYCLGAFLILFIYTGMRWYSIPSNIKNCFIDINIKTDDNIRLDDILESTKKPTPGKSIFFHETSCLNKKYINLTARQACAIESAALTNPNLNIFILFATAAIIQNTTRQPILDAILSYPNVYIRHVNLWKYAANTPVDDWLKDGKLFKSKYVLSHTSDFLRYLTLWRWGGTYLDLDIIVKQNLEKIESNYAGAESDTHVAAGIINFDSKGFGHDIADLCLRNFQLTFDGNAWGNNGPGVITRVLKDICKTDVPKLMTRDRCLGFKVFPMEACYAVRWWNWEQFFDEKYSNEVLNLTRDSVIVHVWNRHSSNKPIKVGSKVAYALLAEKYCPRVYSSCGTIF